MSLCAWKKLSSNKELKDAHSWGTSMSLQVFPSHLSTSLFRYALYFPLLFTLPHHPFLKIIDVLDAITKCVVCCLWRQEEPRDQFSKMGLILTWHFEFSMVEMGLSRFQKDHWPRLRSHCQSPILSSTHWQPKQQPSVFLHLEGFSALVTSQISTIGKSPTKRTPTTSPR